MAEQETAAVVADIEHYVSAAESKTRKLVAQVALIGRTDAPDLSDSAQPAHFGLRWVRFGGYERDGKPIKNRSEFEAIKSAYDRFAPSLAPVLSAIADRDRELAICIGGGDQSRTLMASVKAKGRMLVGAGIPALRNGVGMALHPLYGFPYVAAEALKGLARRGAVANAAADLGVPFADCEIDTQTGKVDWPRYHPGSPPPGVLSTSTMQLLEDLAGSAKPISPNNLSLTRLNRIRKDLLDASGDLSAADIENAIGPIRAVLGTAALRGAVVVSSGLPSKQTRMEVAVWNPHYSEYYTRDEAPADWHQPKPIFVLTLKPGGEFTSHLSLPPGNPIAWLSKAGAWLNIGASTLGVGSRTRKGYGDVVYGSNQQ